MPQANNYIQQIRDTGTSGLYPGGVYTVAFRFTPTVAESYSTVVSLPRATPSRSQQANCLRPVTRRALTFDPTMGR